MTTITADYFYRIQYASRSGSVGGSPDNRKESLATPMASDLQSTIASELIQVLSECGTDGWDGYGAKLITQQTCERAAHFVNLLPVWMETPDVVPEPDGEIAIEWHRPNGASFSISIGERGPVNYAGLFGPNQEVHGVEPFLDDVSSRLARLISEFLASSRRR